MKDAGDFLWPSSLPFDARKFPPGILQALAGEVGIDNISSSGSFVGWSPDAEATLCGDWGRGFFFTFRAKKPFTNYAFSQKTDENLRKMFGAEDESLEEWHKRIGTPTETKQNVVLWALEDTGEVRRASHQLCFD